MKFLIFCPWRIGSALLLGALVLWAPMARALNYEVYPGSAFYLTQMVNSVSYPYTAQFANGFYFHPVGFGSQSDTVLTSAQKQQICNNFSNRFAMVEGDMGLSNPNADINDINTMIGFGLTPIATFVDEPATNTAIWEQLIAKNGALNTPSYEMTAVWGVAAQANGWYNAKWDYLRSNLVVSGCSGIGIDSPVNLYRSGYTVGNPAYEQCVWEMVQFAQANGKRFNYLASPNSDVGQQFLLDMEYVARTCEDNGAEPNVYGVELYGTEPVDLTPETTNYNGVVQANWTTTGLAYYLLKHRDGDPGTLDLYATSNGVNYAQSVMSPILSSAAQIIPFNPAQTNQFTLTLTNNSTWLDYAAVLRARTQQTANWNIAFKIGATDITSSVLNTNGYVFLSGQRLLPNTAQQVTVTLGPIGAPTPLDLVIEALPHAGVDQALDVIAFQYQTNETPPTLDFPTNNWFTRQGMSTAPIWFTVGDAETISTNLTVTAVSSNPTLAPNANIVFGKSGVQRWVNITPAPNQWGVAPITVSVSDGWLSVSNTFLVTVQQTNILPFVKANNTVNLELTNSWVANVVPGPYDQAVWDNTVTATNTVTLGAPADWAGIQITSPGGPVTINGTNVLSLELAGVDLSAASQDLTLNCPVNINAPGTWNVAAGRVATVNSSLSGAGSLTKSGAGTLNLSAANTYSGGTTIAGSTTAVNALVISSSSALGAGAVTIGGGGGTDKACLELAGGITLANLLNSWSLRSTAAPNLLNVSGTNTVSSNISGGSGGSQSTLESDGGDLILPGIITTHQLNLQGAGNGELRGAVNIGGSSLVMNGPGQWTLSASNTYTGNTTISAGILALSGSGSINNSSNVWVAADAAFNVLPGGYTVQSGYTLTGAGSIAGGPVTVASGGTLLPGDSGAGGMTVDALTLSSGSTVNFQFSPSSAPTNTWVNVTNRGGLTINGGFINLYQAGSAMPITNNGTFNLFQYAGNLGGAISNLSVGNPLPGMAYSFGTAGGYVQVTIIGNGVSTIFWNVDASSSWATAANWTSDNVPNALGAVAGFGGGGTAITANRTVTLNGNETVGILLFENSSFGFTINPGSGGTLTLDDTPTPPVIADLAGSHTVAVPLALPSSGAGLSVIVAASSSLALNGAISGTGGLTNGGGGTLTLSGANTYRGGTTLNGGMMDITGSGTLGSATGALNVNVGTLDLGGTSQTVGVATIAGGTLQHGALMGSSFAVQSGTVSAVLAGSGAALTKTTTGTLTLSGTNIYTGGTAISAGTLQLGDGVANNGSVMGNVTNNASLAFANPYSQSCSNVISGTGTLTKSGAGPLILSGANTYSGGTTLAAGQLNLNFGGGPNSSAIGTGTLSLSAGTTIDNTSGSPVTIQTTNAQTWNSFTFNGSSSLNLGPGAVNLATNTTITVGANTLTVGGAIGGTYALTKAGSGTLALAGASTYSGGTMLARSGGVINPLLVSNSLALGTGPITIDTFGNNDEAVLELAGNIMITNAMVNWAARSDTVADLLNVSGTNTVTANLTSGSGGSTTMLESDSGDLVMMGAFTSASHPQTLQGAGNGELRGALSFPATTSPALIMNGTGTWVLAATNSYSGNTLINSGTLLINGRNAGGDSVIVNSGGTLGGTGTVGTVVVNNQATLAPGGVSTIGTLTVSGNLTLNSGSTNTVDVNGSTPANDLVSVSGTATYGGILNVATNGTFTVGETFTLFAAGTHVGNFTSIIGNPGNGLSFNFTNGVLSVVSPLASNPTNISYTVTGNSLNLTWPADHQGWLVQSNSVNLSVPADWYDISNTAAGTSYNITLDPKQTNVFYRLHLP